MVAAFAEFAAGIIEFGLPLAAAQAKSLSARAKSTLFLLNAFLGAIFAITFFMGGNLVADLYGNIVLGDITRWLSIVPLAVGLSAQFRAQLMSDLRFVNLEIITAATQLLGMALAVAVAATTGSVYSLVVLAVVPPAFQLPLLAMSARWHPTRPGAWAESSQIIAVGSRIFGLNLMRNISRTAVVPILGVSESARNVGFYDRAYQLSSTPANALMDSFQRIVVPLLSRIRSDSERLQKSFRKIQKAATMTLVSAIWVVAALGEPIVVLALGEEWLHAGQVMQLLAFGAGFRLMGMMQQWLFIAGQRTGAGLVFNAWAQPLVILVSLVGLPWGIVGVAAASAVAWAVFWPLATFAAARATGLRGKSLFIDSAIVATSFSAPVALSAALPRFYLVDPMTTVLSGSILAAVVASVLILRRASLRAIVGEIFLLALGKRGFRLP